MGTELPPKINIEENPLRLIPDKHKDIETRKIYKSPRYGLTLKKETNVNGAYCYYLMKEYRYTCFPEYLKRGRYMMAVYARKCGIPDNTIIKDFKLTNNLLGKWITEYIKGQTMSKIMFLQKEVNGLSTVTHQLNAFGCFSD